MSVQVRPFSKDELKNIGLYPGVPGPYGMPAVSSRRFNNTPITPKENFLRVCRKELPAWAVIESTDIQVIQPDIMPDAYARNHGGIDWFGIDWEYEPKSAAAMVRPGTRRLSDITQWETELSFPDLSAIDWQRDYETVYRDILSPDRPVCFVIVNGLFERTADLMSFEDAFLALATEREVLCDFYTRLTSWHIDLIRIAKEIYGANMINFHDDMGTQKSSFMSPDMFRDIMLPHYKRMISAAHDMGVYMCHHSCGSVGNLLEYYCEAGWDFWEGQVSANDMDTLTAKYADRLGFTSGYIATPDIPEAEIKAELDRRIYQWGKDGRYIFRFRHTDPEQNRRWQDYIYECTRRLYQS